MGPERTPERIGTIIIGGGQAGLSVGYYLSRAGLPFLILEAHERVGDAWRKRWDSLRLFTPARLDGLAGMRFPARGDVFITKDQMADFLESYASHFRLPVRTGMRVDGVTRKGDKFIVTAGDARFEADSVVVAMANYQVPRVPGFASELAPDIVQVHSYNYRNPSQLQPGGVLLVGLGNSGADIAVEVVRTHPTWLSGKESGHVPVRIEGVFGRFVAIRIVRFIGHRVLNVDTPIGRKVRPKLLHTSAPLIRVRPQDLEAAGVERVPRVVGARDGLPLLADDRTLDVANVIWCTGFQAGFSWIDLPVFDEGGDPKHTRGIVTSEPGLYFVGLHFLYAMTSDTIYGVRRDARRIVRAIASRTNGGPRAHASSARGSGREKSLAG